MIKAVKVALYKDWCQENLFNARGKLNPRAAQRSWWKDCENILDDIDQYTSGVNPHSFNEKIHCYVNEISQRPICESCARSVRYDRGAKAYSRFCSVACVNKSDAVSQKKIDTMIEKYGYVKRFGNSKHDQTVKHTLLEKYGTVDVQNLEQVKEKRTRAWRNTFENNKDEIIRKRQHTTLAKYGVLSHMHLQEYKDRVGLTNLKLTKDIANAIVEKYNAGESYQSLRDEFGFSSSHFFKILHKLGLPLDLPQNRSKFKFSKRSKIEKQVVEFLRSIGVKTIKINDRSLIYPLEIDIVLPHQKIAIEINGDYWHSDQFKSRSYHKNKTVDIENAGFHCIHINESTWINKNQIIKQKLMHLLGQSQQKIAARKTVFVCNIDSATVNEFCEKYHIQGPRNTKFNHALKDSQGEIVAVAGFNRFRDGVELVRYATSKTVIGGLGKILSNAAFGKTVYSFANRYYTNRYNNVYLKNGFVEISVTAPNYVYFKHNVILSRNACMKHKLKNLLEDFDSDKTEYENMRSHGFHRIWDSGNILYALYS